MLLEEATLEHDLRDESVAVVVLASGMKKHDARLTGWKPDLQAHIRLRAGALVYEIEHAGYMLIAGGHTIPDGPSLSSILGEDAVRKYSIPEDALLLEERSVDTIENARYSARILREKGIKNAFVVTNDFHLERNRQDFRKHYGRIGIEVKFECAEDRVFMERDDRISQVAEDYTESDAVKANWEFNEKYMKVRKLGILGEVVIRGKARFDSLTRGR